LSRVEFEGTIRDLEAAFLELGELLVIFILQFFF
jgi:hypothetical protein